MGVAVDHNRWGSPDSETFPLWKPIDHRSCFFRVHPASLASIRMSIHSWVYQGESLGGSGRFSHPPARAAATRTPHSPTQPLRDRHGGICRPVDGTTGQLPRPVEPIRTVGERTQFHQVDRVSSGSSVFAYDDAGTEVRHADERSEHPPEGTCESAGPPVQLRPPAWHPYYRETDLHSLQSVTKSVLSVAPALPGSPWTESPRHSSGDASVLAASLHPFTM